MTDNMTLIDVNGEIHFLTQDQVRMMMTIGWLSFLSSWIMNLLFYKVHPSSVDFCIRDKCFVYVLGKRRSLLCQKADVVENWNCTQKKLKIVTLELEHELINKWLKKFGKKSSSFIIIEKIFRLSFSHLSDNDKW